MAQRFSRPVGARRRRQQRARIGMTRLCQHLGCLAFLKHAPRMQHGHGTAYLGDDAEVVGNEQNRGTMALPETFDQLQHLALHRDVKRGGRLIRYHQARIAGERHRDQHALPHPAGDFVGIQLQHPPRLADRDLGKQFSRPLQRAAFRQGKVVPQQDRDLRTDTLHRIERGHRVLRNQRDAAAEQAAPLRLRHGNEIASLELNGPGSDNRVRWQQAEDGTSQHRFAGAGFPDQSADFAALQVQANATQHVGRACARTNRDLQALDGKRCCHRRCTGSSTKRRPSPSRLNPITLDMMQPIGSAMIHGA